MSRTEAGNFCGLAVLAADTIVSAAYLGRFEFDSDLLASWGDVDKFGFLFVDSSIGCERGDSSPHTFRYQILSLARLPIPPLSHAKSARKNSIENWPQINADDADYFFIRVGPAYLRPI